MYTIQKHLQYNAWANGKIAEILSNVDEKIFEAEVKSSFPSLRKTILHVWDAEQIWLTRIKGGESNGWPSAGFTGTKAELLQRFVADTNELAGYFKDRDHAFFETVLKYKNLKGLEFATPVEEILFHVVNHGTFHRGQAITMLRELGIEKFPAQDLIAYVRQL